MLAWALAIAADVAAPQAIRGAIDRGIAGGDTRALTLFAGAAFGLMVLRGLVTACHDFLIQYSSQLVARDLRNEYYKHLQTLSYSYYDRAETGDLISRAISDIEAARMAVGMSLFQVVTITGTFVVVFGVMFATNWQLALLGMVTLPFLVGTALRFGRVIRRLWRLVQIQRGVSASALTENLTGVRVVKAFVQEQTEIAGYSETVKELNRRILEAMRRWSIYFPFMLFLSGMGTVVVVWFGGYLAINEVISVGTLVAFYYYFVRLAPPSRRIGFVVQRLQTGIAAAERVFEVLNLVPQIASKPNATIPKSAEGRIAFAGVSFGYGRGEPVLREVNLDLEAGKTLGIIGPTGAGKTTLVNLIPRFYDATSGTVEFDGRDVRELDLRWLRSQIAVVPQDAFLFSNTMAKNIAYAVPDAKLAAIVAAAEQAQAGRFIEELPDRYETVVGERGVGLSGGQRQRVTISRALIMHAKLLIMDDSTASVDTATEQLIRAALREAFAGRTVILIGQRVATVQDADEIVVMDAGQIVERGDHRHLMQMNGLYALINRLQAPSEELESGSRAAAESEGR